MAKIESTSTQTVPQQTPSAGRQRSSAEVSFDELLDRSRALASRLSIHKAIGTEFSTGSRVAPTSTTVSAAANDDDHNVEDVRESVAEIGDSIATLIGRLQLLHAGRK